MSVTDSLVEEVAQVLSIGGDHSALFTSLRSKGFTNAEIMKQLRRQAASNSELRARVAGVSVDKTNPGSGTVNLTEGSSSSDDGTEAFEAELRQRLAASQPLDGLRVRGLDPLMYAVSSDNEALARAILSHSPTRESSATSTFRGQPEPANAVAAWLLACGDYGYTCLHYACEAGATSLVAALLEALVRLLAVPAAIAAAEAAAENGLSGPDCGAAGGDAGAAVVARALSATTSDMHLQMAVVQPGGQTPLHLASAKGHLDCCALLLAAAPDPAAAASALDWHGNPPLVSACLRWAAGAEAVADDAALEAASTCAAGDAVDAMAAAESRDEGSSSNPTSKNAGGESNSSSAGRDSATLSLPLRSPYPAIVALLRPYTDPAPWIDASNVTTPAQSSSFIDHCGSYSDISRGSPPLPSLAWLASKHAADKAAAAARVQNAWAIPDHLEPVLVFENVLTSSECQWLVGQAEAAATTRGGWLGDRHRGYATTDLRTSHVSEAVDTWVRATAAERLFPLFRQHFAPASPPVAPPPTTGERATTAALSPIPLQGEEGETSAGNSTPLPPGEKEEGETDGEVAYLWRDLFLVKYAADGGQVSVGLHRDGSSLSFNVMLSDPSCDFTGGGTYFDHPLNYTRQPASIGGCLVHCGKRRHAGNAITRGTRYLLVGFVDEQRRARGAHQCSTDESSAEEASLLGTATAQPIRSASKTTAAYADNASIELHFQDHS